MSTVTSRLVRWFAVGLLASALVMSEESLADSSVEGTLTEAPAAEAPGAQFATFLDRLMRAESNGRDQAANPRSTALGPFQFIKSTFVDVARRHFKEVAAFSDEQVLALRTDRGFARRAAAIYSMENLAYLTGQGLSPSLGHLRLAHLVGPVAAARLMQAPPQTPASEVLGASVIKANPFMTSMSASELVARASRDVGDHVASVAASPQPRSRVVGIQPAPRAQPRPAPAKQPTVTVSCNQKLVVCRRWIAMQANKRHVAQQQAAKAAATHKAPSRGRLSRNDTRPGV